MQGLYLNPDAWYEEREITTWLNTRALRIDRDGARGRARHGRDAALRPADPGDGLAALRPADRRASACPARSCCARPTTRCSMRAFAQRARRRSRAVVAGGGLLGLEAAYALHKLGLRTTVLERSDRLLRRQLDARGGGFLRDYLEGARPRDRDRAPRRPAVDGNGRVRSVVLEGRARPARPTSCSSRRASRPTWSWRRRPGIAVNRGVLVDDAHAHQRPGRSSRPATWPSSTARSPACGRRRSPRPRWRPTTPSAASKLYARVAAGDDPQGRGHRSDVDRPLRAAGTAATR